MTTISSAVNQNLLAQLASRTQAASAANAASNTVASSSATGTSATTSTTSINLIGSSTTAAQSGASLAAFLAQMLNGSGDTASSSTQDPPTQNASSASGSKTVHGHHGHGHGHGGTSTDPSSTDPADDPLAPATGDSSMPSSTAASVAGPGDAPSPVDDLLGLLGG